jgi:hypothetical protein
MQALLEGDCDDWTMGPPEDWERGALAPSCRFHPLLVPRSPTDLSDHYDLTISHPAVELAPFGAFERWLAEAAAWRGLSCALIHDGIVQEAIQRLDSGRLTIGYHLDYFALWHVTDDLYARLANAVLDAGGWPVNHPSRSRIFTDKAAAHADLVRYGLGVPDTVLFRPWTTSPALAPATRQRLRLDEPGARVYLKPANGFGNQGVTCTEHTDSESLAAALATVRNGNRGDTVLMQRAVACPALWCDDGRLRPAYWRVLHCLGALLPFWWTQHYGSSNESSYRRLTKAELDRHHLKPILEYVQALANISGLDWFSTEVCLSEGSERSRFMVRCPANDATGNIAMKQRPVVAVDYINDQCDVDVQSRWPGAPPDAIVRYLAKCFADAAWQQKRKQSLVDIPLRLPKAA